MLVFFSYEPLYEAILIWIKEQVWIRVARLGCTFHYIDLGDMNCQSCVGTFVMY